MFDVQTSPFPHPKSKIISPTLLNVISQAIQSPEAIPILIDNPSIRKHLHLHDIFFDGHGIVEVTLAIKKLLESDHHEIGDFALGFKLR